MTLGGVGRVTNAVVAWALAVGIAGLGWLAADRVGPLWAALAGVVAVVALVPALRYRRLTAVPPWPLLVIAGVPIATRTLVAGDVAAGDAAGTTLPGIPSPSASTLTTLGTFADAAALAAIALLVVAVVQGFSSLRMTTRFGMLFVVVATAGLGGFWAVGRWASERYLDQRGAFVATNEALMHEFALVTAAGVLVALLFGPYFCRARPRPAVDGEVATDPDSGGDGA